MKKPIAAIIGAGIGSLATANLLAKSGWEVSIYEQNASAGGRAGWFEENGFSFDMGPSWYLMPEVFEHYFRLLGEDINDHLTLSRLNPAYKVFYDYQSPVTIYADKKRDQATFEGIESGSGEALERYLRQAEQTYVLAKDFFLYNPFTSIKPLLNKRLMRQLPYLGSQLFQPIDHHVQRFVKNQALRQILEYPMVFLGTSPFQAPAMYHLMSHLDFQQGVYYPQGGIHTIIKSLQSIGENLGVSYNFGSPVDSIEHDDTRASGIVVNGKTISADIVISGADLHHTETKLLSQNARSYPDKYWNKRVASPSALLMYLGIKGKLPELNHHNLLFVKDWQGNFDDIFAKKHWPHPGSLYICKPSATDPNVAPKDAENLFVLVPLPAGTNVTTEQQAVHAEEYLDQIIAITGITDLKERIVTKRLFGPTDFASLYNSWQGSALGLAHTLGQSAMFRPSVRSKKLHNLFYTGANVQPGIGLPMCLISAELIYKHLTGDVSAGPLSSMQVPVDGKWNI